MTFQECWKCKNCSVTAFSTARVHEQYEYCAHFEHVVDPRRNVTACPAFMQRQGSMFLMQL